MSGGRDAHRARIAARELSKPSLTLKRRPKAAPATVYAAWTDPSQLVRWFGPDGGPVVSAEADVRVGGQYRIVFCTEDGEEHNVGGLSREVVPGEARLHLDVAHHAGARVARNGPPEARRRGTLLTLTHEQFFDEPARDRHREGWTGALDKLERLFA